MIYNLRPHQSRAVDKLHAYWCEHPTKNPLLVQPTGAGKSIIIAELCRALFDTYPQLHPRTLVIVPSKELAEQNGEKIRAMLPAHLSLGYFSASLGKREADTDIIVATIGSVYKHAHLLGNIKCVVIDEAHLVNPGGSGRYWQLINDLKKYVSFRVVGLTATPFRGNGLWLTEGENPLFNGVADSCGIMELIDAGYLSSMALPRDEIKTRIDTSNIAVQNGDFNIKELSLKTEEYLSAAAEEAANIAKDRKKWIAFTPTIKNALTFADELGLNGIYAEVVTGKTPKAERVELIQKFRDGKIDCLVTVLALSTGFDVPDVDCVVWLRSTKSPVLYVQGAGRGLRIAPGKENCLWLDFTDTTARLGALDTIKGRSKPDTKKDKSGAPEKTCPECGELMQISIMQCPQCGYQFPPPEKEYKGASNNIILSNQLIINEYQITRVIYSEHAKAGKIPSMRADYYAGMRRVCSEWICLYHSGFAGAKAARWWANNVPGLEIPPNADEAARVANTVAIPPASIRLNESGKYPEIVEIIESAA